MLPLDGTSYSSPSATATAATARGSERIGSLTIRMRRDEQLFASPDVAGTWSGLEEAVAGAAALARDGRRQDAYAIAEQQGSYVARQVQVPVWDRHFSHDEVRGFASPELQPTYRGTGFTFRTASYDYGTDFTSRTGTVKFTPDTGIAAIVGEDWQLAADGSLSAAVATPRPKPTPAPTPAPAPSPEPEPAPEPSTSLAEDLASAIRLAGESVALINTVPATDRGDASTKDARVGAYQLNLQAQALLENQFRAPSQAPGIANTLQRADASLEDANWQLAKKPSPDGRFNGVDIPGAIRDTNTAVNLLEQLLASIGSPATPPASDDTGSHSGYGALPPMVIM